MFYDDDLIYGRVSKKIRNRTRENMEKYYMCLADAFDNAAREYAKKGSELYKAWKAGDFRRFIPSAYNPEYLDFSNYPLKYAR